MSEKKYSLKAGDSVVVKPGTKDPDLGGDIGGWQGRITEFYWEEHLEENLSFPFEAEVAEHIDQGRR